MTTDDSYASPIERLEVVSTTDRTVTFRLHLRVSAGELADLVRDAPDLQAHVARVLLGRALIAGRSSLGV